MSGQGADVLIPYWNGGKDTALDVTVINPLQAAEVQGAAAIPGNESLGACHPVAITEVVKLGKAYARHTGEEEQNSIQHFFQRLSVALMRGNAALFNNRVPDFGAAGEDL